MARKRDKRSVNGKLDGIFYETDAGTKVYLAHRESKQIHRERNAWCLDVRVLEKIRERGVWAVGVVRRLGKEKLVYLTHLDDFFDSPHSFAPPLVHSRQRGLPLSRFRIDPSKSEKFITSAVKLR